MTLCSFRLPSNHSLKVGTESTVSRPTPRPTRRGRRVAAFIVGAAYLAREIIKARYWLYVRIVLEFTTAPPAIALCISTHVWDFQRATTVYDCTSSTARGRRVGVTHQIDRGRHAAEAAVDVAVDVAADYERLNAFLV